MRTGRFAPTAAPTSSKDRPKPSATPCGGLFSCHMSSPGTGVGEAKVASFGTGLRWMRFSRFCWSWDGALRGIGRPRRCAAVFRVDAHDALLPRGEVRPRPVPGGDKMSPTTPVPNGDSRRGQGICVSLSRRAAAIWRLSWTLRAARGTTYSSKTLRSSSMQRMLAHIVRTQTI